MIQILRHPRAKKIYIHLTNRKVKPSELVINLSPEVVKWEKLNKELSKNEV